MKESMIKSIGVAFVYTLTQPALPHFLSVVSSTVVIFYFLTMLKLNAVDKKYKGSWRLFLRSIFNKKRKK